MLPGPAMDATIARRLWRAIVVVDTATGRCHMVAEADGRAVPVPPFSTDLMEAHKIVRLFQSQGWSARLRTVPERGTSEACFTRNDGRTYRYSAAETMPLAICQAALDALDGRNVMP